ncbi:30S ribosomal protein S13 [archaeon]|jgi:small subunit ribosomal protein S13|nr:30S ribosomal protein S13 [archaeon]MBT4242053.1 30S ribosomal protein S13 [archaeon]MBT4417741.1 30S ribosomal protein S13 [archaeon]
MVEEKTQEIKKPEKNYYSIVRIMQTDIPGHKTILVGLTYIKGISWSISNAVCHLLKIDPSKRVSEFSEKEIEELTELIKNLSGKIPNFLLNRQKDFETGEDNHLITASLDMKKEFDIRRLKKIRSYRGLRHAFGHPTRGQRTKSNFRSKGKKKAVGVKTRKGPGK